MKDSTPIILLLAIMVWLGIPIACGPQLDPLTQKEIAEPKDFYVPIEPAGSHELHCQRFPVQMYNNPGRAKPATATCVVCMVETIDDSLIPQTRTPGLSCVY